MLGNVRTRRRSSNRQQLRQRSMTLQLDFRESFQYALGILIEREHLLSPVRMLIEREFSLLTDHSYSASTSSTWYIDSRTSSHMKGAREMFSELSQTETDVEVVLGDDSAVRVVGRGTITFQRESRSPMVL